MNMKQVLSSLSVTYALALASGSALAQDCIGSFRDFRSHGYVGDTRWNIGANGAILVERQSWVVESVTAHRTFDEPTACRPTFISPCFDTDSVGPAAGLTGLISSVDTGNGGDGCAFWGTLGRAASRVEFDSATEGRAVVDGEATSFVSSLVGGGLRTEFGDSQNCVDVVRVYDVIPTSSAEDLGVFWHVSASAGAAGDYSHRVNCECDPITEASHVLEGLHFESYVWFQATYANPCGVHNRQVTVATDESENGVAGLLFSEVFTASSPVVACERDADCSNCSTSNTNCRSSSHGEGTLDGTIPGRPYALTVTYRFILGGPIANSCGEGHTLPPPSPPCFADFNCDGDVGTDADIEAFFAALSGGPTCVPGGTDINGDGDPGTDADIEAFFVQVANGCSSC